MERPTHEPLIEPERIAARVRELGAVIDADFPDGAGAPRLRLVGALKGACFFLSDLARAIERDVEIDFARAASYGASTESAGRVRIVVPPPDDLKGCDVVLVEDVIDSGRTARALLDLIARQSPRTLRVAALLDKPSRRVVDVPVDYQGFEIGDRFVVGYGLDYDERCRNLPGIHTLRLNDEGAAYHSAAPVREEGSHDA